MPRYEVRFPAPPVCTVQWGAADWDRYISRYGVRVNTEPDTIPYDDTHHYVKTDRRDDKGNVLYRLTEK